MFSGDNLNITGDNGFPALIGVVGDQNTLSGGNTGNDTIWAVGDTISVTDTTSNNLFGVIGNDDTATGGPGGDTIWAIGTGESVTGGSGNDLIGVTGDNSTISGGGGNDTIYTSGSGDSLAAGSGNSLLTMNGSNVVFADNPSVYNDTIVGFDQAAGDTIKLGGADTTAFALAHQQNSGGDTLITLNDGSTILLKGVASVSNGFFS